MKVVSVVLIVAICLFLYRTEGEGKAVAVVDRGKGIGRDFCAPFGGDFSLEWCFYEDTAVLNIRGEGPMGDFSKDNVPWQYYKSQIRIVETEEGITTIGTSAFENCGYITNVIIPSTVTSIGESSFANCGNLSYITIPEGVKTIGPYAFENCRNLTNITIPSTVTSIGYDAFYGCSSLSSISIPEGVTSIENGVFWNCISLSSVIIPSTVIDIKPSAFRNCISLKSIIIPKSVKTIGTNAFQNCTNLTSIIIPSNVNTIGGYAFTYCTNLSNITISEGVEDIGMNAFSSCTSLTSITIPSTVTSIGNEVFSGCKKLRSVTYLGTSKPQCSNVVFNNINDKMSICVPIDYDNDLLCGKNVYSQSNFDQYHEEHNHCYEVFVCGENNVIVSKRANATAWENQNKLCLEYECVNESGPMRKSECSSSDGSIICVEGKCVKNNDLEKDEEGKWLVFIEMETTDLNLTDIYNVIINIPELKSTNFTIATEVDENGNIVRIIVIVDDEQGANILCRSVDDTVQGSSCQKKYLRPETKSLSLSGAGTLHDLFMFILTMMTIIISSSNHN